MKKINDLKIGDRFKLSQDDKDIYTIINDLKGAKCTGDSYTNYFNTDRVVFVLLKDEYHTKNPNHKIDSYKTTKN